MLPELTDRQREFLEHLEREIARRGRSPSLREAAEALGVSHTAVRQLLTALVEKGYVRREGRYSREVYILNRAGETAGVQRWREVPIVGRIAAGLPLYAQEEWEGSLVVDASLLRGMNLFALKVRGDSMRDAGILDGDYVICEPRQFARSGEIVVALIGGEEATVKSFFMKGERIELRPENPEYEPIVCEPEEVLIQGKVIGLQRVYDRR